MNTPTDRASEPAHTPHPAYLFFTGLCMGAADVVPGVSGGTMAFVLGIYSQLLAAIAAFDLQLLAAVLRGNLRLLTEAVPWRFLLPLGLGIATAILSLAELITYLLKHHEPPLFAFFFGLVAASIATLAIRHSWHAPGWIAAALGTAVAYWLVGLVPAQPGHSPAILFGSGAIAICAMILPGISGSFILLVLGQYQHCVSALTELVAAFRQGEWMLASQILLSTVLPVAAGAAIGLALFTRILQRLLASHGKITIAALIGFMVGSLRRIWPYKTYLEYMTNRHGEQVPLRWHNRWPVPGQDDIWMGLTLAMVGFIAICVIDHVYDRRNPLVLLITRGRLWPARQDG